MNTYDKHLGTNGEVKIKPEETTSENISNSKEKTPLPEDINLETGSGFYVQHDN